MLGGWCSCCGQILSTTMGCMACSSTRTWCSCGTLIHCGCGRTFEHQCAVILPVVSTGVVVELVDTFVGRKIFA